MQPQPESWLARAKRFEPVKLVRTIKAALAVLSLLGYIPLSQTQVTFFGAQLDILLPAVGALAWPLVEWIAASWLRSKVASPATQEVLARAALSSESAQGEARDKAIEVLSEQA